MRMTRRSIVQAALAAFVMLPVLGLTFGAAGGCRQADAAPEREAGPYRAVVTIPPLEGLVRPLLPGGPEGASQIYVVIPPGRSEHGYEFTPSDVSALAKADLAFYVGLGLETRIERYLSLRPSPHRENLSFAQAVGLEEPGGGHHHHHDHEHGEHCDHGDDDPHIWLDPVLCAQVVPEIRMAVERGLTRQGLLTDELRLQLETAEADLVRKINELHEFAERKLAPHQGKYIVTHHAAWGRLADRYGLKVAAVIRPIETVDPTPGAISQAVNAIREHNVRVIFIEPQFSPAAAERIAQATGVRVAQLDPLGSGDWFGMMRSNIETLAEALAD